MGLIKRFDCNVINDTERINENLNRLYIDKDFTFIDNNNSNNNNNNNNNNNESCLNQGKHLN